MGFVDEENILPLYTLRKKALQIYMGIENIVIITDNPVGKKAHVQAHFKWAHLIFPGIFLHLFPVVMILMNQQIVDRLVNPVIVAVRIRAGSGIAFRFFHKTDFILCGQNNRLKPQLSLPKQLEGIIRHRTCDGFSRQVKNPFRLAFPKSLNSGEHRGNCFSHPGGGFYKQLPLMHNTAVYIGSQFLLPFPVGKWKIQLADGSCPCLLPLVGEIRPFFIFLQQGIKPFIQFGTLVGIHKIPQLFCFYITVGHPYLHLHAFMLSGIHTGIAFGLGQMDIHRLFHFVQITVGSFNLIYGNNVSADNSVGPAFHHQIVSRSAPSVAHHYLRLVIGSHSPLNHAVDPSALRHSIIRCRALPVVYTAAAQDKFHQAAHGYSDFHVTHSSLLRKHSAASKPGKNSSPKESPSLRTDKNSL